TSRAPRPGRVLRFDCFVAWRAQAAGPERAPGQGARSGLPRLAVLPADDASGQWIQNDGPLVGIAVEVEHVHQCSGEAIERPLACAGRELIDELQPPVLLDEAQHGGLIRQCVVDEVLPRPWG